MRDLSCESQPAHEEPRSFRQPPRPMHRQHRAAKELLEADEVNGARASRVGIDLCHMKGGESGCGEAYAGLGAPSIRSPAQSLSLGGSDAGGDAVSDEAAQSNACRPGASTASCSGTISAQA